MITRKGRTGNENLVMRLMKTRIKNRMMKPAMDPVDGHVRPQDKQKNAQNPVEITVL
jgi:hypothetical protein